MRRKGTTKKSSVYNTTSYHKPKTVKKSIVFPKGLKSVDKIKRTIQDLSFKEYDYLLKRHKVKNQDGKTVSLKPLGVTVIFEVTKRGKKYATVRMTPPELLITRENIKEFVRKEFNNMLFNWEFIKEAIESGEPLEGDLNGSDDPDNLDPRYLSQIAINFFYGESLHK